MNPIKLDQQDQKILHLVQQDGRISAQQLADKLNLSPATCWRRLKALEESGVIKHYKAELNKEKLGLNISAVVFVQLLRNTTENAAVFEAAVQKLPNIIECLALTGQYDYLLRVVAKNLKAYDHIIKNDIANIDFVDRINTTIILNHVLDKQPIPVD